MTSHQYEILGIGNPFIDYFANVTYDHLKQMGATPGGTTLIEMRQLRSILSDVSLSPTAVGGGSTANIIKGMSQLGHRCAILGCIGRDVAGERIKQSMEEHGVTPLLIQRDHPTAQAACLITPDKERTMFSCLGAGQEFSAQDLDPSHFKGVRLVHIEGYLVSSLPLVKRAMELAKEQGAIISFDVSSIEVIAKYKREIIDLLTNYVDIVFANRDETRLLTGLPPEQGCAILKDLVDTVVVKMGAEGCWVARGFDKVFSKSPHVDVADTTGAGDLFACGFLHGIEQGKTLLECTHYGLIVASHVIQHIGAEIPQSKWPEIKASFNLNSAVEDAKSTESSEP